MAQRPAAPQSRSPDDELKVLLEELRVALPGVQVLFAFLLTVPFSQRFTELDGADTAIFVVGVVTAALAAVLYIAPSAAHRMLWPDTAADEESLLRASNREAIAAQGLLGLSMVASVLVVVDLVLGRWVAIPIALALAAVIAVLWFRKPRRAQQKSDRKIG
jgi:hypothetical protein